MNELVKTNNTTLSIASEQLEFTDNQIAVLEHLGVSAASTADLNVFFHAAKRTGLDPFAKQIYMISRQGKQTIQTGIDGYRVVGHREAAKRGETVSVSAPHWGNDDGRWFEFWSKKWGFPTAARITVYRNGQPFTAVALFDEYAGRKYDGGLNSMWSSRPAGQLAKCAEALAWRMAFPQDLAGIYTAEEMEQADNNVQAPAYDAPTATPAVDWEAELAKVTNSEEARALYSKLPTAELKSKCVELGKRLVEQENNTDDIVDAEVVEDAKLTLSREEIAEASSNNLFD